MYLVCYECLQNVSKILFLKKKKKLKSKLKAVTTCSKRNILITKSVHVKYKKKRHFLSSTVSLKDVLEMSWENKIQYTMCNRFPFSSLTNPIYSGLNFHYLILLYYFCSVNIT